MPAMLVPGPFFRGTDQPFAGIIKKYYLCIMLEDNRIKVFLTVLECGNFTAAAYKLGISQPAVSQNIAELERLLGVQLMERARGEISLTESVWARTLTFPKIWVLSSKRRGLYRTIRGTRTSSCLRV